jgi:hypothetical protein
MRSQEGFLTQQFGWHATTPAVGDYDGDGKVDVAVEGPGDTFYVLESYGGKVKTLSP